MTGSFKRIPKPVPEERRRFGRAFNRGTAVLGTTLAGAYVGYRAAWKRHDDDINADKMVGELNTLAFNYVVMKQKGLPLDGIGEKEVKEILAKYKATNPGAVSEHFWKTVKAAQNNAEPAFYIKREAPFDPSKATQESIAFGLGGGFFGLIAGVIVVEIVRSAILSMRSESSFWKTTRQINEALARNKIAREEQRMKSLEERMRDVDRRMQRSSEGNGSSSLEEGSGSWKIQDSGIDDATRRLRRAAKEREVELAIRNVCGGACSREVAFSLIAVLSHRQTQLLLEEPANLKNVLAEHREEIEKELGIYGLSVNQILAEIDRRNSSSDSKAS